MQISIAILVGNANQGISYVKRLVKNFKARVLSYPNSIFEAEPCLVATLTNLNNIELLRKSSLVITPNAYTEGILYDVIPNTTLGDMDVVRATTATRVNSAGLIEVVPRNLFTYSNTFTNAAWGKLNATVTANAIVSPDGTTNASKLVAINPTGNNWINQTTTNNAGTTTFTVYAKQGEYNGVLLYNNTINSGRLFNLNTGALGSVVGVAPIDSRIESVGNGWYRVILITNSTASNEFRVYIANNDAFGNLGNGTSGIFVYGAQLENFGSATEYFPTTTRLNIPRIDYTNGSCPSLLVEPQRTNLITYSQNLSDASYSSGADLGGSVTRTVNYGISPDGTQNATRLQIVRGATYAEFFKRVSTTAGSTYTLSFYAKSLSGTPNLYTAYNGTYQNPITFTNQWVRYTYTFVASAAAQNGFNLITFNGLAGTSLTADLLVWGVQLELGAYPTSYIPTVASSVTRNADVISKTGISSLIGQTEGTIFLDFELLPNNINSSYLFALNDGTNTNMIRSEIYILSPTVSQFRTGINTLGVGQGDFFTTITQLKNKMAISYSLNNVKIFINGALVATDTSATIPTMNTFNIGNRTLDNIIGSSYKQAILFKTQLSNAECIALTTL